MKKLNLAFYSTSEFGDPILEYLLKNHNVKYVVSSYPKPRGRGQKIKDLEFVKLAKQNNIDIIYVNGKKELTQKLEKWHLENGKIDFAVVVDFAYIIETKVFDFAQYYFINIHPSILPKYRGPSPIQFTLLNNEYITGVTIQKMEKKVDVGDILIQKIIPIDQDEEFNTLYDKLKKISVIAIKDFLENFDRINAVKQNEIFCSYSRKIEKNDAKINFNENVNIINGKIKAFSRWPKVKVSYENDQLILLNSTLNYNDENNLDEIYNLKKDIKYGEIVAIDDIGIKKYDFDGKDINILTLNTFNRTNSELNSNFEIVNNSNSNNIFKIKEKLIGIETYNMIINDKNKNKVFEFVKNNFQCKIVKKKAIIVKCKDGYLNIIKLQKLGKKKLEVRDFLLGYRKIDIGKKFD